MKCFGWGKVGHLVRDCLEKKETPVIEQNLNDATDLPATNQPLVVRVEPDATTVEQATEDRTEIEQIAAWCAEPELVAAKLQGVIQAQSVILETETFNKITDDARPAGSVEVCENDGIYMDAEQTMFKVPLK